MKAVVIYWSETGNTENMANGIADGIRGTGSVADLYRVGEIPVTQAVQYDKVAFGCPAMGNESLEKREFETFFRAMETVLAGKSIALFGSYGWGDGEWMRNWAERVKATGARLFDELAINQESDSAYDDAFIFGKAFAVAR
ncbi:MAG: flavodoxin [Clostridia bacterium]|nr:flavodoxin [Clostridia bacterium]